MPSFFSLKKKFVKPEDASFFSSNFFLTEDRWREREREGSGKKEGGAVYPTVSSSSSPFLLSCSLADDVHTKSNRRQKKKKLQFFFERRKKKESMKSGSAGVSKD